MHDTEIPLVITLLFLQFLCLVGNAEILQESRISGSQQLYLSCLKHLREIAHAIMYIIVIFSFNADILWNKIIIDRQLYPSN